MSYRQEMARLSRAVGELLARGGAVHADDVRAALAGHSSLVGLLKQVHRDVTGASAVRYQSITELERHPVAQLGGWLNRQPWISDQPLSIVLNTESVSRAGELWREVAEAATLAQADWDRSAAESRPTADFAWSEIADVAVLAEAVAVLDEDIADSLAAAGRWRDAVDFRAAARAGLRVTAREVFTLASTGPLPIAADPRPPTPTKVMIGLTPAALPEALGRLDGLLTATTQIPPAQVAAISRVLAETALSAAAALESASPPVVAALKEHAARLAAVAGNARRVAALQPGDRKALAQAEEIHRFLTHRRQRAEPLPIDVADGVARALPEVTASLATTAENQIASHRWVVPQEGSTDVAWGPYRGLDDQPHIIRSLRHAVANNHALVSKSGQLSPTAAAAGPVPRALLAQPLAARSSVTRPALPGTQRHSIPRPH